MLLVCCHYAEIALTLLLGTRYMGGNEKLPRSDA